MRLKSDLFGTVTRIAHPETNGVWLVERDARAARWWVRPLALHLMAREARALRALAGIDGFPKIERCERSRLVRSWIAGNPMQLAAPRNPEYFSRALKLLRRMHRAGVAHNDLAKEPNWLVTPEFHPALVDFQLALTSRRRGRLFRSLAREDIRHLLKHKRTYCPARLTQRELNILATPALVSRVWMSTGKKLYLLITRRLLGWSDREGAGDR